MEYSVTFYGNDLYDLTQTIEFNLRQLKFATVRIDTMSSYSRRSHRSNKYGDTRSVYSVDESRYGESVQGSAPSRTSRRGSSYSHRSGPSYIPAYQSANAPDYDRGHRVQSSSGGDYYNDSASRSSRSSSRSSRSDRTDRPEDYRRARRHHPTYYASSERYIGSGGYPDSKASYTSKDIATRRDDYTASEIGWSDDRSSYTSSRSSRSNATFSRGDSDDRSCYSSSRTSESTATFSPLEQKNDRRRHGEQEFDAARGFNVEYRRPPGDVRRE